ncbi:YfkD family protein [Paraliobacillus sp. JSM ZJ581]|uniref:YfkD family protein n=1 Tax=Paraliobacillus sp. JSM ZJ581 TaxID=3342118 RepID=UPI0035A956C9
MKHRKIKLFIVSFIVLSIFPVSVMAKEKGLEIPNHVLSIANENTYSNSTEDEVIFEPNSFVEKLMEDADVDIENPKLIQLLNESSIKTTPFAIGYRGSIYMGHWPLNYQSDKTEMNWEYQKINTNELINTGNDVKKTLSYNQLEEAHIKGALTTKIDKPDQIKKLILLKVKQNMNLPLSFHTIIGKDTKKANAYTVPMNKNGQLDAYAPAINEKGAITYGDIYIELKGSKKKIVVKNVTKQSVGAWIPIQDHLSFSFQTK